jgi:pyruvate formate lyase activating enzyme
VGIPYNNELISLDEVIEMRQRIAGIDPWIQVCAGCALDYRPEFKSPDLIWPGFYEMMQVHFALKNYGLQSVICQTKRGKIGPNGRLLQGR